MGSLRGTQSQGRLSIGPRRSVVQQSEELDTVVQAVLEITVSVGGELYARCALPAFPPV
jgi:hypothetical protein